MAIQRKKYPTVACCGLDCGLCPAYHSSGKSRCPGCCGPDFSEKHPSCSIITCCIKQKNLETCAECDEFPCTKIDKWDMGDSFISHKKALINLRYIKKNGMKAFVEQQKKRMTVLKELLNRYNEGRSKSYYCIAAALLSISSLKEALKKTRQRIKDKKINPNDIKVKSVILKDHLDDAAKKEGVDLKLRKK
ncbi:MAG: DUF3795 domain-containing protein [bacterium]|nr:DUF3795 domain-containing protein [bacterium]